MCETMISSFSLQLLMPLYIPLEMSDQGNRSVAEKSEFIDLGLFFDRVDTILPSHSGLYHGAEFY